MSTNPLDWFRSQVRIKTFQVRSEMGADMGTLRVEYRPNDPDNLPVLRILATEVRR